LGLTASPRTPKHLNPKHIDIAPTRPGIHLEMIGAGDVPPALGAKHDMDEDPG
jgi:hypothetical protein